MGSGRKLQYWKLDNFCCSRGVPQWSCHPIKNSVFVLNCTYLKQVQPTFCSYLVCNTSCITVRDDEHSDLSHLWRITTCSCFRVKHKWLFIIFMLHNCINKQYVILYKQEKMKSPYNFFCRNKIFSEDFRSSFSFPLLARVKFLNMYCTCIYCKWKKRFPSLWTFLTKVCW